MRTRLLLRRPDGMTEAVVIEADAVTTVGDVADTLVRADPRLGGPVGEVELSACPVGATQFRSLPRAIPLLDAGLRAGSTVAVTRAARRFVEPGADVADAAARLIVLGGPDAGLEVLLPAGVHTVGRGRDVTVRLDDRTVSQRHARLVITDGVEVVDNGSSNGVQVGGGLVARTALGPDDVVRLGDTTFRVERLTQVTSTEHGGAVVAFNRPPLVVPRYAEKTVEAPAPPEPAKPQRFPWLAMLAPALLGVGMYAMTQNVLTLAFVGLSPLLMLGSWLDRRTGERRRVQKQAEKFRTDLTLLAEQVRTDHTDEVATRLVEHPSTAEVVDAALTLSPLLWCRRPDDDDFLSLRLGTGTDASRTTVRLPARGQADGQMWADLEETVTGLRDVQGVPLVAGLREVGGIGIAGAPLEAAAVARSLVAQLVCLHSPAEVVVAGVASARSAQSWRWLTWLPHTASAHSPLTHHLGDNPTTCAAVVGQLEELVAARRDHRGASTLPAVVLVVEDDAPVERGRLVRLAEEGPERGVHVIWCAARQPRLPAACRAFLVCHDGGVRGGSVPDRTWRDVTAEPVDEETTGRLGLHLTGVVDAGAPVEDETDLPRAVGYLALAGPEVAEDPGAVIERWRETGSIVDRHGPPAPRRTDATLRAVIGQGVGGEFVLDLRSQGPHALVGGTTGSGKSEFLQAWVLGMAAAHSPDRVTFLFVDYKGGAAFADCVGLPHCVGLVTDLSPHLVRRALTSLRAELRHREQLLHRKKAKDLLTLERSGDPETPPALVIVVDEFAALVSEVPEFVDGVVDVAQRGRSLGLHLVLATQRPAGVIKDNLRANTNLRVALRTADEHDSTDVLGSPMSAHFDPGVPGRGAVRTGPGRIALFQTAYAGGRSGAATADGNVEIESLAFGPGERWTLPTTQADDSAEDGPTDISRVVRTVALAARTAGIRPPRRPWLPDLAAVYDLADLPVADDTELPLGVVDLPEDQRQAPFTYRPDDGALALFGTGGSGTSTALRTLAVGAGQACAAGFPVQVYGLDLGAGGLAMLDSLPHVGSVVEGTDVERVTRLLRTLLATVEERSARYAQVRAGSITQYRTLAAQPQEPRILLLLDGLSAFRDAWESEPGRSATFAAFRRIVSEGRPLGVHVVMAAERPGALPTALAGSVPRRIVLRQADDNAYGVLDVPTDVLSAASPPGRAVPAGTSHELQLAVPGGTSDPAEQGSWIEGLAGRLRAAGVTDAPAVRRLPSFVTLSSLPASADGLPVLGVADDTLAPLGFEPRGTFLVAGLPGSGRTTVLASIATSLRRYAPQGRLYYVGNRRSPVHAAPVWTETAVSAEDAAALARRLLPELAEPATGDLGIVLVIESITDLLGGPAEQALAEAVKTARRNDHLVVAESETSTWGSAWPLVAEVRNGRRGLVLQPDHLDGDSLFRTPFPRMARAEFPPGRGVVVESGRIRRVQVPVADAAAWPELTTAQRATTNGVGA